MTSENRVRMIKRRIRDKTTTAIESAHFKLMIDTSPYLSNLTKEEFVVALKQGLHTCIVSSQPALTATDKVAVDLILSLEDTYNYRNKPKKQTENYNDHDRWMDDTDIRDFVRDLGLDIGRLINIYLLD